MVNSKRNQADHHAGRSSIMNENTFTTFTENDMYGLLEIYDGYDALIDAMKAIVGKKHWCLSP